MLPRWCLRLATTSVALALVSTAHAGVTVTRVVQVAPERPNVTGTIELPVDMRLTRADLVSLECAVDGVRAPAGTALRIGYQGFERGRHVAWLELPDGSGLPAEHAGHAATLRVRLQLERSDARPLARERVVEDWERGGGLRSARAMASSAPGNAPAPFKPTQVPSLLGSPVEYLIVTTDALVPAFQRLADWKTASGVPAAVRTLSFIREQYPVAVDDPERIRNFVRDAYSRWGTRWVLLGGDTELLPPRIAHVEFLDDEFVPTDLYFSCLDGNWNADGDSTFADAFAGSFDPGDDADLLPEVYVGRAPVVTPVDAELFVKKTLTYETTPVADYMENSLCFAKVLTPDHWVPGQPV